MREFHSNSVESANIKIANLATNVGDCTLEIIFRISSNFLLFLFTGKWYRREKEKQNRKNIVYFTFIVKTCLLPKGGYFYVIMMYGLQVNSCLTMKG
ncbi:UNVERIFIED_CONTAM: hypothetical protein NCL1_12845 [Trichonephila clavipes]